MNISVDAVQNPKGFVVTVTEGAFRTLRYILTVDDQYSVVNPFGDATLCPTYDCFELAMGKVINDVEVLQKQGVN